MKYTIKIICLFSLSIFIVPLLCIAAGGNNENTFEIVSDYTYHIDPGDSQEKYESLCLFGAKLKAVSLSAKYLNHTGVLNDFGAKQKEIFCLVTDGLKFSILEKKTMDKWTYYVKIKTKIRIIDFTKAEIKNIELEKKENNFSWQEEMDQYVDKSIDPGKELSRAYRYLRKKNWRIAIIYLDHLQKKYPNWQELYSAKAIGFFATNKIQAMMNALKTSCALGNREACQDMEGFIGHNKNVKTFIK